MKQLLRVTTLLVFSFLLANTAIAFNVTSRINNGSNTFSDNSAELFFDLNQNNSIDVGDVLLTAISMDSINSTAVGFGTAYEEVTVLLGIEIASGPNLPFGGGAGTVVNSQGVTLGSYTATTISNAAYTAVDSFFDLDAYLGADFLDSDGTVGYVFIDGVLNDGTNAIPEEANNVTLLNNYTDGSLVMELGLLAGNYINVLAPDSLTQAALLALGQGNPINDANFSVNLTINEQYWTGVDFGNTVTGNGVFQVSTTPNRIRDDGTYFFNATTIPEPATMTLFGIGLLSLAAVSRRRKE